MQSQDRTWNEEKAESIMGKLQIQQKKYEMLTSCHFLRLRTLVFSSWSITLVHKAITLERVFPQNPINVIE